MGSTNTQVLTRKAALEGLLYCFSELSAGPMMRLTSATALRADLSDEQSGPPIWSGPIVIGNPTWQEGLLTLVIHLFSGARALLYFDFTNDLSIENGVLVDFSAIGVFNEFCDGAVLGQGKKRSWGKFFKTRHRNLKKKDQKLYIRVPHR